MPEGSVGFVVVADKNRKEDGGGDLDQEAQQGQQQSPARGAAWGPGHGTEATSLESRAPALGSPHAADTPGRAQQVSPEPGPAHVGPTHAEATPTRVDLRCSQLQPGKRARDLRWGKDGEGRGRSDSRVLSLLAQLTLFRLVPLLGNDPGKAPRVLPAEAQRRPGRWRRRRESTCPPPQEMVLI